MWDHLSEPLHEFYEDDPTKSLQYNLDNAIARNLYENEIVEGPRLSWEEIKRLPGLFENYVYRAKKEIMRK